jgi:hypothetical protein
MYTITNPITKPFEIEVNQEESKAFSCQGIDNEKTQQNTTYNTKNFYFFLFWLHKTLWHTIISFDTLVIVCPSEKGQSHPYMRTRAT